MRHLLLLLVTCRIVCAACDTAPFDVNDVSFLFPKPRVQIDFDDYIPLTRAGGISNDEYHALVPESREQFLPAMSGDKPERNPLFFQFPWVLTAIRVDPCAKDNPSDTDCRTEFRLVYQPLAFNVDAEGQPSPGKATVLDSTIHFVYVLPPAQRPQLIADLFRLKRLAGTKTNGLALGPHPVMSVEGHYGPYESTLRSMVERYATRANLQRATHGTIAFTHNSTTWSFDSMSVQNGTLAANPIAFTDGATSQKLFMPFTDSVGTVTPPSTAAESGNQLLTQILNWRTLNADQQQGVTDTVFRLQNPTLHTLTNIDCVSCHVSARVLIGTNHFDYRFLTADDGNPNRFRAPAGTTANVPEEHGTSASFFNFRAFGYGFDRAAANLFTVSDSARIAGEMNGMCGKW